MAFLRQFFLRTSHTSLRNKENKKENISANLDSRIPSPHLPLQEPSGLESLAQSGFVFALSPTRDKK